MQNFESGGGCLRPSKFGIRSLEVSIREIVAPACPVVGADLRAARRDQALFTDLRFSREGRPPRRPNFDFSRSLHNENKVPLIIRISG